MSNRCETAQYAIQLSDLPRLARQLGYVHLARRIDNFPRGMAGRHLARCLSTAAAAGRHVPHSYGGCRRIAKLDGFGIVVLTTPRDSHHVIRSARAIPDGLIAQSTSTAMSEATQAEAEALFDNIIG